MIKCPVWYDNANRENKVPNANDANVWIERDDWGDIQIVLNGTAYVTNQGLKDISKTLYHLALYREQEGKP